MPLANIDIDRILLDALKAVHNEGAKLYNDGDPTAAVRVYQGALAVAAAFLVHRPPVRQAVRDGMAEVVRVGGNPAVAAYRLHEVIDHIRFELKSAARPADGPTTDKLPQLAPAPLHGRVVAGPKAVGGVVVMLTVPAQPMVSAAVVADRDGAFTLSALPNEYIVTLAGPGVTTVAAAADTSPFHLTLPADGGRVTIDLLSPGPLAVSP